MMATHDTHRCGDLTSEQRAHVQHIVAQLDPILPGQAPLPDFVHHNTLHGFQHLPFDQALAEWERITGITAYLSEDEFRRCYTEQRITDDDLDLVLSQACDLESETVLFETAERAVYRRDLYRLAMIYGIEATTPEALRWMSQEWGVFERIMDDIPPAARHRLLQAIKTQTTVPAARVPRPNTFVRALWRACAEKLGLPQPTTDQAEPLVSAPEHGLIPAPDELTATSAPDVARILDRLGDDYSLLTLLSELTGRNGLETVRPVLTRHCASFLDEGVAAWHAPDRAAGLYAAWRQTARYGVTFESADLATAAPEQLPTDPATALAGELNRLGLPQARWEGYLRCIALESPGWCGLVNWRVRHRDYPANETAPTSLVDVLAVRLILDRLWSDAVCREVWGIAATLPALRQHFRTHSSEFAIRRALFRGELPEHLSVAAHRLTTAPLALREAPPHWQHFERQHRAWLAHHAPSPTTHHTLHHSAWRLFRLAQHLGLTAPEISALPVAQVERLLRVLDDFTPQRRAQLWLLAYERHYRQRIFAALAENHGRGRWQDRGAAPQAQIICCMDDREESFRRHLEELNPTVETLGAAGFFGVPMHWQGIDDTRTTPLCPIVVTPTNVVREVPRADQTKRYRAHGRQHRLKTFCDTLLHHELRRNLLSSYLLIDLLAPVYLLGLTGKILFPRLLQRSRRALAARMGPRLRTTLTVTAATDASRAPQTTPRVGFTDAEQTARVEAFLRNIGLVDNFAPIVILLGHGSSSENNPHRAAYDCGACSGRHGGPNARAFAAIANRTEIRRRLAGRGLQIPDTTWFIGAQHDTCSEAITWFDLEDLLPRLRPLQHKLSRELDRACQLSAQERCRRFASAPANPTPARALRHVVGRAADLSQPRPELGHATNAAAFVGRRAMSQGIFLDRRVFLISYDPRADVDGTVLEGILLAVGPVGAGINLEYYFSTVASDRLGCGTKVPHNLTGFFGVMEGASSDLRTGLPRQMTEIHEAMRLLIVVEQSPDVLNAICRRQALLRELIINRWVLLGCKDPRDGTLWFFEDGPAFVEWHAPASETPSCSTSAAWHAGHRGPVPPALIRPEVPAYQDSHHA